MISRSRRQLILGFGGAVLAEAAGIDRTGDESLAQTVTTSSAEIVVPAGTLQLRLATPFPERQTHTATLEPVCPPAESQDIDTQSVDFGVTREFVTLHEGPVGLIRWNTNLVSLYREPGNVNGRRWCSGTLIAPDLFLTAGHCFAQDSPGWVVPRINGTNDPISRTEIALNMHVEFLSQLDATGNDQTPQHFAIIDLVEDRLADLDYAIVRLDGNPGLVFGAAQVAVEEVPVGEGICIIGYPEGVLKRIAVGLVSDYDESGIVYNDLDMVAATGSAILSIPDGAVVGVHTNGGCNTEGVDTNHGVSMVAMLSASPILRELVEH